MTKTDMKIGEDTKHNMRREREIDVFRDHFSSMNHDHSIIRINNKILLQ